MSDIKNRFIFIESYDDAVDDEWLLIEDNNYGVQDTHFYTGSYTPYVADSKGVKFLGEAKTLDNAMQSVLDRFNADRKNVKKPPKL